MCADKLSRRCMDYPDAYRILSAFYNAPYGGHFGGTIATTKVLQSSYLCPSLFKDVTEFI